MFVKWGFLLAEIWVLLALAILIGLFAGWLIWGGRRASDAGLDDYTRMRTALGSERTSIPAGAGGTFDEVPKMRGGGYVRPSEPETNTDSKVADGDSFGETLSGVDDDSQVSDGIAPVETDDGQGQDVQQASRDDETPALSGSDENAETSPLAPATVRRKPPMLREPRDGIPDDLTKIKGIGAAMQTVCNRRGFFHYEQIADWTAEEVAWIEARFPRFKGRVTRDKWVDQARVLARRDGVAEGFSDEN